MNAHPLPIHHLLLTSPPVDTECETKQKATPSFKDGAAPRCHLACERCAPQAERAHTTLRANGRTRTRLLNFARPTFPATFPAALRMRLAANDRISLAPARRVLLRCTVVFYAHIVAKAAQRVKVAAACASASLQMQSVPAAPRTVTSSQASRQLKRVAARQIRNGIYLPPPRPFWPLSP